MTRSLSGREVDWRTAPIFCLNAEPAFFGIEAADARGAAVGRAHPFQDFDGGGFSRAIGAEQAEDFTFLDGEADAADGFDGDAAGDVGLEQAFDGDDGFRH